MTYDAFVFNERTIKRTNKVNIGNGGLSTDMADLFFAAKMKLLLKPKGKKKKYIYAKLKIDWRNQSGLE